MRLDGNEREAKRERWMRIAADAARQCDAKWLPEVVAPVDFARSLEHVKECRCFVGALVDPRPRLLAAELAQAISEPWDGDWGVYIGPEGDFTKEVMEDMAWLGLKKIEAVPYEDFMQNPTNW